MAHLGRSRSDYGTLLLRLMLGAFFIAHLGWKFFILKGGIDGWWANLIKNGYAPYVPYYVFSVEVLGSLLLIPGILTRYVDLYAMPMMAGAAHYWLTRKGFYFTSAGCEMPLTWLVLLGIQALLGDGPYALVRSPDFGALLARFKRGQASAAQ